MTLLDPPSGAVRGPRPKLPPAHRVGVSLEGLEWALGYARSAERAFLESVADWCRSADVSMADLSELQLRYRGMAPTGFSGRWDEIVPVNWSQISEWRSKLPEPFNAAGHWKGTEGSAGGSPLVKSTPVVYMLFDGSSLVYIGSTGSLSKRLKAHRRDKSFTSWRAWPCASRDLAYVTESDWISAYLPALNSRTAPYAGQADTDRSLALPPPVSVVPLASATRSNGDAA